MYQTSSQGRRKLQCKILLFLFYNIFIRSAVNRRLCCSSYVFAFLIRTTQEKLQTLHLLTRTFNKNNRSFFILFISRDTIPTAFSNDSVLKIPLLAFSAFQTKSLPENILVQITLFSESLDRCRFHKRIKEFGIPYFNGSKTQGRTGQL